MVPVYIQRYVQGPPDGWNPGYNPDYFQEITPLMCSERQMSTIDEKKCIQMSDFDCVYCGLIFQSTQELADHQTKHQSERPFICPICNRMFQEYGQAVVHGIAIHSQEIVPKTTAEQKR